MVQYRDICLNQTRHQATHVDVRLIFRAAYVRTDLEYWCTAQDAQDLRNEICAQLLQNAARMNPTCVERLCLISIRTVPGAIMPQAKPHFGLNDRFTSHVQSEMADTAKETVQNAYASSPVSGVRSASKY